MLKNQHARFLALRERLSSACGASRALCVPAALAAALLVAGCASPAPRPPRSGEQAAPMRTPAPAPTAAPSPTPTPTPPPPRLVLAEAEWSDLPGWTEDAPAAALPALQRSCDVWRHRDPTAAVGE